MSRPVRTTTRPVRTLARRAAPAGLVAGASREPFATTYGLEHGSPVERAFYLAALDAGYREFTASEWPCDAELEDTGQVLIRDRGEGVYRIGDAIAYVGIGHGWLGMRVAAASRDLADATVGAFSTRFPPLYRQEEDEAGLVPITFWTYGQFGPQSRLRMIGASPWADISSNYPSSVRAGLAEVMAGFEPGKGGQLMLWQGSPGTGKTWALRALASEWRPWAEFHYITDPDAFFVRHPPYMIDVLLADSYEELAVTEDGAEVVSTDRAGKWRILILEDTGELLAADAKKEYGQGLSRLLNVVDGLVGQGLRVLVLVTTNDELGELHPAVKRPGRCASQIEFVAFTAEEASEWLGSAVDESATLADLFSRRGDGPLEGTVSGATILDRVLSDEEILSLVEGSDDDEALAALVEFARSPLPEED